MSGGTSVARASGTTAASFVVTSAQARPSRAISTGSRIGSRLWLSRPPPLAITVVPVSGSTNSDVARPSQNRSVAKAAPM